MSVNSSSGVPGGAPISFSGIVSGLDTSSIITQLLALDKAPINALQTQIQNIQTQEGAIQQLQSLVQAVGADMQALSTSNAFTTVTGNSSNTSVATLTTTSGAAAGTYNLKITQLAQAEKIVSAAQADLTTGLNQTGTFVLNGHAIDVVASDSLTTIAQKINSAGAGVTASVINGGAGSAYMSLTSSNTGAANAMQLSDLSGTVMNSLGLIGSTAAIRQPITNGALSSQFSSATSPVGTLLGASTPPSGNITVNGINVAVNFATDSLQTIASNINSAGTGATASVQTVTANGKTSYQLQITGASTPTFADPNGLLGGLGVLQNNYGDELVPAKDAAYSLDNVNLTSPTNTVTSAIPGATITLLSGTNASPGLSTLSLSTDTSGIGQKISTFVSDYNSVVNFVAQQSQLNTSTFQTGPLFGDFTTEQVMSQLGGMLFKNVPGLSGSMTNLAALGFSLDKSNNLQLNQTTLNTALSTNPSAAAAVFAATGTSTSTNLSYIASTAKTAATGNPMMVNVTQIATKGSYTAEQPQTAPNPLTETLTFTGSLFANVPYSLTLNAGNDLTATINQINSDPTLSQYVVASNNGGSLKISSNQFGTPGNFTVTSNYEAASNNSGIGVGSLGTTVTGLDVAGTINGETANGSGQFLTGASGNATTDGLEVQYTGTATGSVGSITFSNGIASQMNQVISSLTTAQTGPFATDISSMNQTITGLNQQITDINAQVTAEQTRLQLEFANMEQAVAALQQQGSSIGSMINSLNGTSGGSSNSSSGSGLKL
ncbi:MAG TPA: flagellar filament capping protein FliD [Fimbriimonadaceae bacterium]|nr:flagellar filament capping protein FliD [Fimbriimonadaceae bacterium]